MTNPSNPLTERERDVLTAMADGLSNKEIAQRLIISYDTVRWYAKRLFQKLEVSSRAEAVSVAHERGLLQSDESEPLLTSAPLPLPSYTSAFIGRTQEIREIIAYLTRDDVRLVTIVGPGGSGKTRLTIEVGARLAATFPDGVYFIPMNDSQFALETFEALLGRSVNLHHDQDVFAHLANKQALMIFDNFEETPDQTTHIATLLDTTEHLTVLITGQAPIDLHREWLYRIQGLSTQRVDDAYSDAVTLFIQRAKQVDHLFDITDQVDHVHQICDLLGGYPLAIELAASWVRSLSCEDILADLQRSFDMLASNAADLAPRHRSIKAVFEYSWQLLTDDQRKVLRRLAVFDGSFGANAARRIADTSTMTLATLIDRSLVVRTSTGQYRMQKLLRRYALEQLATKTTFAPKSNAALAMYALIRGEFDLVEKHAQELLDLTQDVYNVDKGFALALLSVIAGTREDYEHGLQLARSSLQLTRDFHVEAFFSYLGLGIGYCGLSDSPSARTAIQHALNTAVILKIPAFRNLCVPVMAVIAADEGIFHRAVQLCGYASLETSGLPHWLLNWGAFVTLQDALPSILSEEAFHEGWQQGRSAKLDEIAVLN